MTYVLWLCSQVEASGTDVKVIKGYAPVLTLEQSIHVYNRAYQRY